ncbi:unnamed protein product [Closterium sp. NIES-54]
MQTLLGSSCEAEIYAGAMAAQELRWLTYLLTNLGEAPRSPPVLYVDNKAMLALCQEHRLEHRTKHIALRYFLARELQQCGQLHRAYMATRANTADIFTKALLPCDHQRFCTMLCSAGMRRARGMRISAQACEHAVRDAVGAVQVMLGASPHHDEAERMHGMRDAARAVPSLRPPIPHPAIASLCPLFIPFALHSLTPPSPLSALSSFALPCHSPSLPSPLCALPSFPLPSIPSPRHPLSLPSIRSLCPAIPPPCHPLSVPSRPSLCPPFPHSTISSQCPPFPPFGLHSLSRSTPPRETLCSWSCFPAPHSPPLPHNTNPCPTLSLSAPPSSFLSKQYRAMVYSCPDCPATGFTTRGNVTNHWHGGQCPRNLHNAAVANSGNPFLMNRHNAASMPSPNLSIPSPTLSMPTPLNAEVDPEPLRGNEGSTHDNMVPDSFHPASTPSNSVDSTPDVLPDDATSAHTNGEAAGSTNDGEESPPFTFLNAFVHCLLTCGVSKKKVDE